MPKIDLNVIKGQFKTVTPEERKPEYALICPHGPSGSGKTTLWGWFGATEPGTGGIVQTEKGDRDLDNPHLERLNINKMFNIGNLDQLTVDGDTTFGDFENIENAAMGWDYIRTITEELLKNGGKSINPAGRAFKHMIFDSGTDLQKMGLAWIMRNTPNRKRPAGPEGSLRPALEDYGDLVFEFDNWMLNMRDLKTRMNVVVIFLTNAVKSNQLSPDGFGNVEITRYMPMVIGKKLPQQIISYADFAPFHQEVEVPGMTPIYENGQPTGKMKPVIKLMRGLRWHPTSLVYAKGRGKLRESMVLLGPDDLVDGKPIGWDCHKENLRRICEAGNIPM